MKKKSNNKCNNIIKRYKNDCDNVTKENIK